jgi:Flp pilus assembly protein TadD
VDGSKLKRLSWSLAPALAALIVYAMTLSASFLYDDDAIIRTNRWVSDPGVLLQLPGKPLLASSPVGTTNYYRPVVNVVYNLTWQAGGGRPFAFHLINILLHALNASLLLMLIERVGGVSRAAAIGAALLFAVHPLNTEVVAWPSCLPELGYTAFGLSALLLQVASWRRTGRDALPYRAGACACFFLALACKETALAFIPLVFVLELWARPQGAKPGAKPAAMATLVPYVVAAGLFFVARTWVLGGLIPPGSRGTRTLADAVLNAPWLVLLYVKSMLVPMPLLIQHVLTLVKTAADVRFLLGVVALAAGAYGVFRLRESRPGLAFAACLVLFPVLPALYIPALGRDPFAERYAYLSVAGFCWLLVGGVAALTRRVRVPLPRWGLPALLGATILAAGAAAAARTADWKDDETLGRASMRDAPEASLGYMLAGQWHVREGDKEEALRLFNDGLAHVPESVELQQYAIGLGIQLGHLTQEDAVRAYERLVPLAAGSAPAQFNLGQALLQNGRLDQAKVAFERALALSPRSVPSMTALAVVASKQGDDQTAIAMCRRALAVDDHSTQALQQLGVALLRQGDLPGAVATLERAVALDATDKESLNRLGVAYIRSGRRDDARRAWESALAIDPQFAGAQQNLQRLRQMAQ